MDKISIPGSLDDKTRKIKLQILGKLFIENKQYTPKTPLIEIIRAMDIASRSSFFYYALKSLLKSGSIMQPEKNVFQITNKGIIEYNEYIKQQKL